MELALFWLFNWYHYKTAFLVHVAHNNCILLELNLGAVSSVVRLYIVLYLISGSLVYETR